MQAQQAQKAEATGLVRIKLRTRRDLKVESAERGISMLAAVEEAVSAWLRNPRSALDKRAKEATRPGPRRARKSA